MMRFVAVAAAAALLVACAGTAPRPEGDPAAMLAKARAEYAAKDYEEAAATLRELLESRPPAQIRVEGDFLAGETAMAREEFAEARTFFADFANLYPGNPRIPEAHFQVAETFYQERNRKDRDVTPLREARARFIAFLAVYPGHPLAGAAAGRVAEATAALVAYERGIADLYLGRGAWAGAAGRLEAIVREYPGTPDEDRILYDLAAALVRAGEPEKAATYRERLLKEHPDSPWAAKASAGQTGVSP